MDLPGEVGGGGDDDVDYNGHNAGLTRLLHGPPEGRLGVLGHRVGLVENNDLVGGAGHPWGQE